MLKDSGVGGDEGRISCRERLGGTLKYYFHEKAQKVKELQGVLRRLVRSEEQEPLRHASIRTLGDRGLDRCMLGSVQSGAAIYRTASVGSSALRLTVRRQSSTPQSPGLGGWVSEIDRWSVTGRYWFPFA